MLVVSLGLLLGKVRSRSVVDKVRSSSVVGKVNYHDVGKFVATVEDSDVCWDLEVVLELQAVVLGACKDIKFAIYQDVSFCIQFALL